VGRDQLRAVAAQPLGVDLVGRGVVPDAVALVDGGHEGLLAPPGPVSADREKDLPARISVSVNSSAAEGNSTWSV
jgi:hypothetical protein